MEKSTVVAEFQKGELGLEQRTGSRYYIKAVRRTNFFGLAGIP